MQPKLQLNLQTLWMSACVVICVWMPSMRRQQSGERKGSGLPLPVTVLNQYKDDKFPNVKTSRGHAQRSVGAPYRRDVALLADQSC